MGIFKQIKSFVDNRRLKTIERNKKLVENSKAVREERQAALDFFKDHNEPEVAVPALLVRFDYSLENGITDTREKETALQGILAHGAKALPFVLAHLKASTRIAWPIKIYQKLASPEDLVSALFSCLNFAEVDFDQEFVDKNYDILCYLYEYPLGEMAPKILHFLGAHDERVRFAAAELLLLQDHPASLRELERFLTDESSENIRLRQSVTVAYLQKGWSIQNPKYRQGPFLPRVQPTSKFTLQYQ